MTRDEATRRLARRHVEKKSWPVTRNDPKAGPDGYIHYCADDHEPWPCDVHVAIIEASTLGSSERLAAALRDMVVANLGSPDKFDPGDLMSGLPSVEELAAEIVRHLPALSDPDAERQRAIAALDDGRRHHAVRDHEPMWACDGCVPTAVKHELTRAAALPAAQERQRAIGEDRAVRLLHAIREALDVFDAGRDGFDAVLRAALRHDERTRGERIDPMVEQFRA
jgi:hypothetical protein